MAPMNGDNSSYSSDGSGSSGVAVYLVIFVFFMILVGAIVGLYFWLNHKITKTNDTVVVLGEHDVKALAYVSSTFATNSNVASNQALMLTSHSNLQKAVIIGQSNVTAITTSLGVLQTGMSNITVSSASNIKAFNDMSTTFKTNTMSIGGTAGSSFSFLADASSNLTIKGGNSNMAINMLDNNVNFSNIRSYNANFDKVVVNGGIDVNGGGMSLMQSGALTFATVGSSYSLDTRGTDCNLRLMMALGSSSNAGFDVFTSASSNQTPATKVHSFDDKGNAMHAGNIVLSGSNCIDMGNGSIPKGTDMGKMCYLATKSGGLDIFGGSTNNLSREINVWDNMNVNNMIKGSNVTATDTIGLGDVTITTVNGQLILTNNMGGKSILTATPMV
jgi:hypothetical protein